MQPTANPVDFSEQTSIGIPEIDKQHAAFMAKLEDINTVSNDTFQPLDDDGVDDILDILSDLRDFALLTFGTEESLMLESDYPDLDAHKEAHEKFIDDIGGLEAEVMNGTAMPPAKILSFVQELYLSHIADLDKAFSKFYNNSKQ